MDISEESLALHYKLRGKLEVVSRYPIQTQKDLSLAYTPGVAAPCLEIQKDPAKSFQLTRRQNLVAVITDGSAVLAEGEDWTRIWDKIQADTPFALSSSMWFPVAGEE